MVHLEQIPEREGNLHRLGRHVRHDPRSQLFGVASLPYSGLISKRWPRRIPVLDQGNLGSCTAQAATGWLGTDNAHRTGLTAVAGAELNEDYAKALYSDETRIDGFAGVWPPDDTGSNGLAAAKVLKRRGLVAIYRHAFGLRATLSALQSGPVLLGVSWLQSMFEPTPEGKLNLAGAVAGGHEILLDEIDVKNQRVWLTNSWGAWGFQGTGRAWLSWDDLRALLAQRGDVVVPFAP